MTDNSILDKALEHPEELNRLVIEHVSGLIYMKDIGGGFLFVSNSVEDILGYAPVEFIKDFDKILVEDSEHNQSAKRVAEMIDTGEIGGADELPLYCLEFKTKDGRSVIHEMRERFVYEKEKRVGLIGFSTDVTEYYHMLDELKRSNKELMVVHHSQDRLRGASSRRELFEVALDASLSMLEFGSGVVYDIDLDSKEARLAVSRNVDAETEKEIGKFDLPVELADGSFKVDKHTSALLLAPGHSWLEPLKDLDENLCGLLIFCMGHPDAFIIVSIAKPFTRDVQRLFQSIGIQVGHSIKDRRLYNELEKLSLSDPQTGLYNRSYAEDFFEHESQRITRYKKTASLVIMKVDNYTEVSKRFGSDEMGECLTKAVKILSGNARSTDTAFRYNDDEFIVFLPETGSEGSESMIKRSRKHLTEWKAVSDEACLALSFSLGAATVEEGEMEISDLILQARENTEAV